MKSGKGEGGVKADTVGGGGVTNNNNSNKRRFHLNDNRWLICNRGRCESVDGVAGWLVGL